MAVERSGVRAGKAFCRQSWLLLSHIVAPDKVVHLMQAHRDTIANQWHWVQEVVQGEAASLLQAAKPATLLAY
ncbi:MAG: hypothetical protein KME27_17735 [Lyngbya sp. HA4199-MV5]|nr:hypothetical protein [Lyngbya sp. HA4199-MV5]